MNKTIAWIITAVILFTLMFLLLFRSLDWVVPTLLLTFVISIVVVALIFHNAYVYIGELEYGVVFFHNGDFSRFLDSGWRTINPLTERLTDKMTKGSQKAQGTSRLRTRDGVPVDISWSVSFKVDIDLIRKGIEY